MRIIRGTAPGALRLAGRGQELSAEARRRLKWMDYYESHGHNARLTCRHFDISPQTFYRWRGRYDRRNLGSLQDRSRRPHRVRQTASVATPARSTTSTTPARMARPCADLRLNIDGRRSSFEIGSGLGQFAIGEAAPGPFGLGGMHWGSAQQGRREAAARA